MTKEQDWQNGLKEAFQRKALTGLFIDLQRDFLDSFTFAAFNNSSKIASNLSARNIPNIWAIWPTERFPSAPYTYQTLESFLPHANEIVIAAPANDDLVFCKYKRSLLTNPEAKTHIKTLAAPPVIIAGGVYASRCFSSTVNGLIDMIDCDIIVPFDATDMESVEDAQKFFYNGKTDHMLKPKGRIHPTSTAEVLDVIHALQPLA
jgi:isochorismate hydrolase